MALPIEGTNYNQICLNPIYFYSVTYLHDHITLALVRLFHIRQIGSDC